MILTVLIPTRNRAELLRTCLDRLDPVAAALADAGHTLTVLVSDNAATDHTQAVLAAPRPYPLRHVRRAQAGEIYESIATAMWQATIGPPDEAVVLIGDDDGLEPATLITALNHLAANPAHLGVAAGIRTTREDGTVETYQTLESDAPTLIEAGTILPVMDRWNYLEAVIVRRRAWRDLHPFADIGLPCQAEALVQYALNGGIMWIGGVLILKTFHQGAETTRIGTAYHQARIVEDHERAWAELVRQGLAAPAPSILGTMLARSYSGITAGLKQPRPAVALSVAKRIVAHRPDIRMPTAQEEQILFQAGVEHLAKIIVLSLARSVALPLASLGAAATLLQQRLTGYLNEAGVAVTLREGLDPAVDLVVVIALAEIPAAQAACPSAVIIALDALWRWHRTTRRAIQFALAQTMLKMPL